MLCFWCLPLFPQCLLLSTSVVALNFGRRGGEGRGGEGRGGEGRGGWLQMATLRET